MALHWFYPQWVFLHFIQKVLLCYAQLYIPSFRNFDVKYNSCTLIDTIRSGYFMLYIPSLRTFFSKMWLCIMLSIFAWLYIHLLEFLCEVWLHAYGFVYSLLLASWLCILAYPYEMSQNVP